MNVVDALAQVADDSVKNDLALLKLGEVLANTVTEMRLHMREIDQRIDTLQKQVLDLHQKIMLLAEMYHTHFTDTDREVH